jgi:hypothetical protein
MKWHSGWKVQHLRNGKLLWLLEVDPIREIARAIDFERRTWQEVDPFNILHNEGEQAILSAYFATAMSGYGAPPANLYLGLDARVTPAEADALTSLSGEPSGSGYARKALSTAGTGASGQDFYINQPAAYYKADSKTVTFTASGGAWSAVTQLFLCTVSSGTAGKLVCTKALTASRTLQDGDSLNASMYIGLSE